MSARALLVLLVAIILGCRARQEVATDDDYSVGPSECAMRERWYVHAAMSHEGEVWVIDSALHLWSFSLATNKVTRRLAKDSVVGLAKIDGELVVVAEHDDSPRLLTHAHGRWQRSIAIPTKEPLQLLDGRGEIVVLGRTRVWSFGKPALEPGREMPIEPAIPKEYVAAALSGDRVYLVERGEERSSMIVLELTTGKWRPVVARGVEVCRGLFDDRCSDIDSVVADPSRDGCIIVATPPRESRPADERLLRVCGSDVAPLWPGRAMPKLYGLMTVDGRVCGLSGDELVCIRDDGTDVRTQLPAPREVCRLQFRVTSAGPMLVGKPAKLVH